MGELMEAYFAENSLVRQHLESFNKFLDFGIQRVIDSIGYVEPNIEDFKLKLGKVRLEKPTIVEADGVKRPIYPHECRLRNLTYASRMYLDINPVIGGVERRGPGEVYIGTIPIMLKSKMCHLAGMSELELAEKKEDPQDPGGYFIVNGSEKALVSIEDLAPNRIMVSKEKDGTIMQAKVFSTREGFRARCVVERNPEGIYTIFFPVAPRDLLLIHVLKALGLKTNEDILEAFSKEQYIRNDVLLNLEQDEYNDPEESFDYIGKRAAPGQARDYRIRRAEILLDTYLLPHLGTTKESRMKKAYYLVKMAEKTSKLAHRKLPEDDKDHYANKRIKLAGALMEELFRYAFQFLVKDIAYQAERAAARGRKLVIHTLVRPDALSERIRYSMATGNWIAGQTGVAQLLDRTSYLSSVSHLRRIISPLSRKHPHFKARDLHGTHWGKICPNETPEGPSCSLVKNLSLLAEISTGVDEQKVAAELMDLGVKLEE